MLLLYTHSRSNIAIAKLAIERPGAYHIPSQFTPIPLFGMSNYRS